jgi:integrase-like protein
MKGHIKERGTGHWYAVIDTRDPATGKRKRKWHSLRDCTGRRQAQIECARLISEISGGTYLEPNKTTVAQFLERWLDHMKSQISPKSHERYCELARKNIVPLIGAVPLPKPMTSGLEARGRFGKTGLCLSQRRGCVSLSGWRKADLPLHQREGWAAATALLD